MPVASRRTMPPRPSPHPLQARIFLGCLAAGLALLTFLFPSLAVAFGALFVFGGLAGLWESRRQARVAAQRLGESICSFARGFGCRRTDTRVIRAVYEELQPLSAFPLRPSDELDGDLRVDGEDLDLDIAPALAARTGRSLASTEGNPHFGRVRTVADLVAFFCAQPLARSAGA